MTVGLNVGPIYVTEFSLGCSIYVEFIHVGVSGKNQGLKFYLWSSAVVNKWWYQVCFETDHTWVLVLDQSVIGLSNVAGKREI